MNSGVFEQFLARKGATAQLARDLGITHAAVRCWRGRVPAERVVEVERVTGIPREALRPDLYIREPATQHAAHQPARRQMAG